MILFDIKLLVIALAALVLLFLLARYRYKVAIPLTAALLIATHWSYYFRYEYNGSNIFLLDRINIYPLILWTVGLTTLHLASYKLPRKHRLVLGSVSYLVFLMIAEAVGYYLLDIRLQSNYTSLLGLGVIHAPVTMKAFYVFAGPAYLVLLELLSKKLPIIEL